MGFFPFFSPLYPWVVDELQRREDNPISSTYKNPWAILISPALLIKAGVNTTTETNAEERKKKVLNAITSPPTNESYKGCIISNNINNLELSYAPQQTIVGVDFTGEPIRVTGEMGRKISTPVIESIDVDTDGANNTLKTAKVTVRCFSLKQFEMFEMFFMKPGMNVLIEWGDNSLLMYDKFELKKESTQVAPKPNESITDKNRINKTGQKINNEIYKRPEQAMVLNQTEDAGSNKDYNSFCQNFSGYFRSDTTALVSYLNRIEKSRGSYDLVAGKVLDYSFSINDDGTYTATFDISQGNQMTQWVPKNATKPNPQSTEAVTDIDISDEDSIIKKIAVEFNLDEGIFREMLQAEHPEGYPNWMNDWFNFIKINKEQKDTIASSIPYISLRFILVILMNYAIREVQTEDGKRKNKLDHFFMLKIPQWIVNDEPKPKYIIPCKSNKFIFSSSEQIIYPLSEPPKFVAPVYTKDEKSGKVKLENEQDENKIRITTTSGDSIKIGPYDFNTQINKLENLINQNEKGKQYGIKPITVNTKEGERIGNALNIFLNYDMVLNHWRRAYTRKDFLEEVLRMCNNNSYGLFQLVYGNMGLNGAPCQGPTIIDIKLAPECLNPKKDEITYRFKPTTLNSTVKQFSFNFEMSNLVAGRTLFNSSKFLEEAIKTAKKKDNSNETVDVDSIPLPPDAYKSVDNSTFGNADGWYSINKVEFMNIEKKWEETKNANKSGGAIEEVSNNQNENTQATTEIQDLNEVIKNKSKLFLIDETVDSNKKMMIFVDPALIQSEIQKDEKSRQPTVSPVTVTITIDGFSGFTPGQYFNIDGVPEIYNKIGVFQITNTKHNITKDGWTTTIEAEHRPVNKK